MIQGFLIPKSDKIKTEVDNKSSNMQQRKIRELLGILKQMKI